MGKPKRNDKADYNVRHEKEIEAASRIFKERIADSRISCGYTQKEVAEELDMSLDAIRAYEQQSKKIDKTFPSSSSNSSTFMV